MSILGNIFIIAAPSGVGKTSLINALVKSIDQAVISVSYTTRPKGRGEIHKEHYYFISEGEFQDMDKEGDFLEKATVYGHLYGTSKTFVKEQIEKGNDVFLDIDWQGMRSVKKMFPKAISIYLLPPSRQAVIDRLKHRKRDEQGVIDKRMQKIAEQASHCTEFDYIVINDDFEQAKSDLVLIVRSKRLKKEIQVEKYQSLLGSLLADKL